MFGSIRWRLVASYVLLTLLTVGVMGGLALSLVWRYVDRREAEFLTANAETVARHALPLVAHAGSEELGELARSSAFVINARVRLLDARQQVLADSGPVTQTDELIWMFAAPGIGEPGVAVAPAPGIPALPESGAAPGIPAFPETVAASAPANGSAVEPFELPVTAGTIRGIRAEPSAPQAAPRAPRIAVVRRQVGPWGERMEIEALHDKLLAGSPLSATTTFSFTAALPGGDFFAFGPDHATAGGWTAARSSRDILVPVGGPAAVGYVEISQGPDFASAALRTTARAFGLAALGAALLAGVVGLVVSRGMTAPVQSLADAAGRMSAGDLSARAPVRGRDELAALASQFNAMAAGLEGSFADLAAERDALRRFIADASHELRTPITALQSFNELMQTSAAADPAAQAEFLAESGAQIQRLAWITANLLDLSRLDAGLVPLDSAECSPSDLVEAAAAPFRTLAAEREILLSVARPPEPSAMLTCDPARIELALSNLLDNALKFTPAGGRVEIGLRQASARPGAPVAPHELQALAWTEFWVRDDGPGIAADDLRHVFERFYRGQPPAGAGATDGSGLGLAIVQSIAHIHGGEAGIESTAGGGTRAWLRIPSDPAGA